MCEFCTQHGEGKKWYLTMRNYSRELWEQDNRKEFSERFTARFEEDYGKKMVLLDTTAHKPLIGRFIRHMGTREVKARHWGQVVPIEDVELIIDLQDTIVRLPCVCRQLFTGRQEGFCFGVGFDPTGSLGKYPDYSHSLEVIEKEEAKRLIRSFDAQGLVHSVYTFKTPYIGGLCNCDQDCMSFRMDIRMKLMKNIFRAEYVGMVNWELCNGCKKCLLACQFGAINYYNTVERATIDMMQCYGCGVCRAVCDKGAITLKPRTDFARVPW